MKAFQSFDPPASVDACAPRIARLRTLMAKARIDALMVPHADEYHNEYLPLCAERLAFMTGFTGSAGLAVIAAKSAALFVDGRYAVQAPAEVDAAIFAVKGIAGTDLKPWLIEALGGGGTVGFDSRLHTLGEIENLKAVLGGTKLKLKGMDSSLVDRVWGKARPGPPDGAIEIHPIDLAGRSSADKLADLQKVLKASSHDAVVLTAPDSVCWLFNIRGSDVAHNPIVLAQAIVPSSGKASLFVAPGKVTAEVKAHLAGVAKLHPPEAVRAALVALKDAGRVVRVSPQISWTCAAALGGLKRVKRATDPCAEAKAIKNAAEIAGARAAHMRDGAAVTRFLAWLDRTVDAKPVDEVTAVKQLEHFRRDTGGLREVSFPTISGSGPHGAVVHYRVTTASNRTLRPGELFLIDSGGQYRDGTTDITRTVAIGEPTPEMRQRFTLVLQGMIAVSQARFPRGTRGIDLDPLARRALWAHGLNYDHGTGHGIGSYLCVHEGPQSISRAGMVELKPGMMCSNEPGYYKAGCYGIRIENVVLVTEPEDVGGDLPVMAFETLTLAPIDRHLIEADLLSADERAWIDGYHGRVRATLAPLVDPATAKWLKQATAKL